LSQPSSPFEPLSEFLQYLAIERHDYDRIPTLSELSRELGISVSRLREQLEVARSLGIVEVKPKTGIRRIPYTFLPTLRQSLGYAMAVDENAFDAFSDLRNKIESVYWYQAVSLLTSDDRLNLMNCVERAEAKIHRQPPQIPHTEHRELHLLIYGRLGNPFVIGILEGYWDLYESIGLSIIMDVAYLELVWQYHRKMVEAIQAGDFDKGFDIMREHLKLIHQRSKPIGRQRFE
jgi:DNA-binding FadR family transcriptional regulator